MLISIAFFMAMSNHAMVNTQLQIKLFSVALKQTMCCGETALYWIVPVDKQISFQESMAYLQAIFQA